MVQSAIDRERLTQLRGPPDQFAHGFTTSAPTHEFNAFHRFHRTDQHGTGEVPLHRDRIEAVPRVDRVDIGSAWRTKHGTIAGSTAAHCVARRIVLVKIRFHLHDPAARRSLPRASHKQRPQQVPSHLHRVAAIELARQHGGRNRPYAARTYTRVSCSHARPFARPPWLSQPSNPTPSSPGPLGRERSGPIIGQCTSDVRPRRTKRLAGCRAGVGFRDSRRTLSGGKSSGDEEGITDSQESVDWSTQTSSGESPEKISVPQPTSVRAAQSVQVGDPHGVWNRRPWRPLKSWAIRGVGKLAARPSPHGRCMHRIHPVDRTPIRPNRCAHSRHCTPRVAESAGAASPAGHTAGPTSTVPGRGAPSQPA